MKKTAWAIETRDMDIDVEEFGEFIGFGWTGADNIPGFIKPALFGTRRMARAHLPRIRRGYPRARVVKVELTITIVGGG